MTSGAPSAALAGTESKGARMALVLLAGAGVALALGVYAKAHTASGRPVITLGFSGVIQMKAWLTTAAAALLIVQLVTALWMWGKLPGADSAPDWAPVLHRWSGAVAFTLTLPVAFSCIWTLGFSSVNTRVLLHSVAGCVFYGAYASKMLGLRLKGLPGWALPVLGGSVFAVLIVVWLTAALWFFTSSHMPLT